MPSCGHYVFAETSCRLLVSKACADTICRAPLIAAAKRDEQFLQMREMCFDLQAHMLQHDNRVAEKAVHARLQLQRKQQ